MTHEKVRISKLLNDQFRCGFRYLVRQFFFHSQNNKRFTISTIKNGIEIFEFKNFHFEQRGQNTS